MGTPDKERHQPVAFFCLAFSRGVEHREPGARRSDTVAWTRAVVGEAVSLCFRHRCVLLVGARGPEPVRGEGFASRARSEQSPWGRRQTSHLRGGFFVCRLARDAAAKRQRRCPHASMRHIRRLVRWQDASACTACNVAASRTIWAKFDLTPDYDVKVRAHEV